MKVSEEMFTCKQGEQIVDVYIKVYFENNSLVAENRRSRVETEAITSTANHRSSTSVHFVFPDRN